MILLKKISLFLLVLLVLHSCKKDEDVIEKANIGGNVLNLCTDSAFANVTVNFITKKPEGNTSIQTISDANGNFLFNNISINHNSDYSYYLYIESYSGIAGLDIGFDGISIEIDKTKLAENKTLPVVPHYRNLCFKLPTSVFISNPDSIHLYYYQKKFHKNVPILPWNGNIGNIAFNSGDCGANYPMGLWNFTIDKWKSGVHTTTNDSIYLNWGETKTYTVNW